MPTISGLSEYAAIFLPSSSSTGIRSSPFLRHNRSIPNRNLSDSDDILGVSPAGLYGILTALVLISLAAWAFKLIIDHDRRSDSQETLTSAEQRRDERNRLENEQKQQLELAKLLNRIQATGNALIVKQVVADCDTDSTTQQLILGNPASANPKLELNDLDDDNYQEKSLCVICLQAFRVGDLVAWSKRVINCENDIEIRNDCHHVFHRDCIESWLIAAGHDDCPSCRTTLLKIDSTKPLVQGRPMEAQSSGNFHLGLQHAPGSSTRFVIVNGLVSRLQPALVKKDDDEHTVSNSQMDDTSNSQMDDSSSHSLLSTELNHMISYSDLLQMNQASLGTSTMPGSGLPTRPICAFSGMLFTSRSDNSFRPPPLTTRSSSLWRIDDSQLRRLEFKKRSLSELPWRMNQGRQCSRQLESPSEVSEKNFQQTGNLLRPMAGDPMPDQHGSRPLPRSQSFAWPMDVLKEKLNRVAI